MLQDACDRVPFLTTRLATFLSDERPEYALAAEPLLGWVEGWPVHDPMATFFTPLVYAAKNATHDATRDLGALRLRAQARSSVDGLLDDADGIADTANTVHTMLDCGGIHEQYIHVHTAVCCDVGYAFFAQFTTRLVGAWSLFASLLASIAGYKRFRRKKDLWGPYASVEALEVGSYL